MREDLLTELQLPKIDVKCLQEIVKENSARLARLLKENEDFMKKNKIVPAGYKKIALPLEPDTTKVTCPSIGVTEKPVNGKVREVLLNRNGNMGVDSNHDLDQFLENSSPPTVAVSAGCVTLASDLGWGSEDEEQEENEMEVRSYPMRCNIGAETPPGFWDMDFSNEKTSEPDANACFGTEFLGNSNSNINGEEKTEITALPEKDSEAQMCDPLEIDSNAKPLRCYSRKRNNPCQAVEPLAERCFENNCEDMPKDDDDDEGESALCVISEVVGNANSAFCSDSPEEKETQEAQLITPKKTNDITKIKGWRRKQFFVEKSTTIEFYSFAGGLSSKKKIKFNDSEKEKELNDPGNIENAFVCDSLDEFLDREAELKINYEIPHLYAEFGIKLTSEEIVSRPNLSEEDFKSVETRYCVPVPLNDTETDIALIEYNEQGVKRCFEDENDPESYKVFKVDDNKRRTVKVIKKHTEKPKIKLKRNFSATQDSGQKSESKMSSQLCPDNMTLTSKLLGLVVYPGPGRPLHPIVQHHLLKLRSYRTEIDRSWANFASSAVVTNKKNYRRKILPVHCCGKVEKSLPPKEVEEVVQFLVDSVCADEAIRKQAESDKAKIKRQSEQSSQQVSLLKRNIREYKVKECSVVIDKINTVKTTGLWCMEHNCYNCPPCGLMKTESEKPGPEVENKTAKDELGESVIASPQASFDKKVAGLVAKKLKISKFYGDTLTSIDCLKSLTANTIEFIKLNFIKQSFLTGYINIWYLKPKISSVRSRAFLTFSQTPPVPNAINLKSSVFSLNSLPKVITEIVSADNPFDSNEYAILHCDGKIWEIHGSMNIAVGKSQRDVDQIFTPVNLPELKVLQSITMDILRKKVAKWWVMDLTQDFKQIELISESVIAVVTRKKFLSTIKSGSFGFMPICKDRKGRVFGVHLSQILLPFVLIGPYYLLETHDVVVKNDFASVPFMYYGEENVSREYPLKFFINSVLKEFKENNKKLEGLWLYDKILLDNTCYLEVMTTKSEISMPKQLYSINVEHGYSLNSLTCSPPLGSPSGIIKSGKDGQEELKKVPVYLYFDFFELGYVKGKLQLDNSVLISHPLDGKTKVRSHKIGDWFIGTIKRRIQFIPGDLTVKWFVTKHKEDLRDRSPFNKFYLGGAHILCKSGLFYRFQMTESRIQELGLDKKKIVDAIADSQVINEVKELRRLANVLSVDSGESLTMNDVLMRAKKEIKTLESVQIGLMRLKTRTFNQYLKLTTVLLRTIYISRINFNHKIQILEKAINLFVDGHGNFNEDFLRKVNLYRFGRIFLKRFRKGRRKICYKEVKNDSREGDLPEIEEEGEACSSRKTFYVERVKNKIRNDRSLRMKSPNLSSEPKGLIRDSDKLNAGREFFPGERSIVNSAQTIKTKRKGDESQNNFPGLANCFVKLTSCELPKNITVNRGSSTHKRECKDEAEINSQLDSGSPDFRGENFLKNEAEVLSDVAPGNLEGTSVSRKNNIVIIKNLKNNKTAVHKLNLSQVANN